ncbi:MAG TPA: MipA/OmpV family protein [Gammaproteobacteria bacterium]|jgi:outer membrane scaffolding protein for murein synthesis (MipA/OmpV family)
MPKSTARHRIRCHALALSLCLPASTSAPLAASDWSVGLGAGVISAPEYLGGDSIETFAVPAIDIAYRRTITFNFYEGLNAYFFNRDAISLKAGVAWQPGRDEDEDPSLAGIGDIDDATLLRLVAEYQFDIYTAFFGLRRHYGGTDGTQFEAGIQAFYTLREEITSPRLLFNLAVLYSDDDYMQGYFGIDAGQAAASGLQPYSAESGISSLRAGATAFYPLTRNWRLTGVLQYRELVGDAGDSPLVLQDGQWFGGAFVGYRF